MPTADRSRIDVINVPLEPLVAERKTLSEALAPLELQDFDSEPLGSNNGAQASETHVNAALGQRVESGQI